MTTEYRDEFCDSCEDFTMQYKNEAIQFPGHFNSTWSCLVCDCLTHELGDTNA